MKYLLLFCFLAYVTAFPDVQQLLNGSLIHLGPYNALVKIGNISSPYKLMDDKDLLASKNAKELAEEARRMFKVGFYTLPPLDPYTRLRLPDLVIDKDLYISSGKVVLRALTMSGAQKFHLDFLEIRLKTGRVDLGFSVPKLNIEVDFTADILIAGVLPIHLNAHLSLLLKNVSVVEAVQVEKKLLVPNLHYQLVGQHSRLHVEDLAFKLVNIKVNDIVKKNTFGSSAMTLPDILNKLKKHIDRYVATLVLQQTNAVLEGPTAEQVNAYLLPEV